MSDCLNTLGCMRSGLSAGQSVCPVDAIPARLESMCVCVCRQSMDENNDGTITLPEVYSMMRSELEGISYSEV
eukprot:5869602-Amphidinium_carterae.2